MYARSSSGSLAIVLRFIDSGKVEGIGAAVGVGMRLTCGVGTRSEGNIVEVEVGGTIIGKSLETAAPVVSPIGLNAFWTSSSS